MASSDLINSSYFVHSIWLVAANCSSGSSSSTPVRTPEPIVITAWPRDTASLGLSAPPGAGRRRSCLGLIHFPCEKPNAPPHHSCHSPHLVTFAGQARHTCIPTQLLALSLAFIFRSVKQAPVNQARICYSRASKRTAAAASTHSRKALRCPS